MTVMRTLIDNMVLIGLEDNHVLEQRFTSLCRDIQKIGTLLVHPALKSDINRDKDAKRREITLSKYCKYLELENPPVPDAAFLTKYGVQPGTHDETDATLLYSILRNAAHFLITEDLDLLRKAELFSLGERILTIDQAATLFARLTTEQIPSHPLIKSASTHELDLADPFFDSLKQEYPEFSVWFQGIQRKGRKCWVLFDGQRIEALDIYKREQEADHPSIPVPTLKLCTFKVADTSSGKRVAELLLKLSFKYAVGNNLKSLYLTVFPTQERLIAILREFGFFKIGTKGQEEVYLKELIVPESASMTLSPLEYAIHYYPSFLDGPSINKFIIPIRPEYFARLFPDFRAGQRSIDEYFTIIPEGNTIKKAYICNSKVRRINKGDVILFYQSTDLKSITSIGVVESTLASKNPEEIIAKVGNRTVYSFNEIQSLARPQALVIIFRHIGNFSNPISNEKLKQEMGIAGNIQSIRAIDNRTYQQIKKEGQGCL